MKAIIDPVTGKKISELNHAEYRDYNRRKHNPGIYKYLNDMPTLQEQREAKDNQTEDQQRRSNNAMKGKFISECLTAYVIDDKDKFDKYPETLKEIVKSMIEKSKSTGNFQEVLNRIEGKVKDEIDLTTNINTIKPNQEEIKALEDKFSKSIEIDAQVEYNDNKQALDSNDSTN